MPVIQLIGVLDTSEAIPNHNPYTFSNDTLSIDLFFGNTWQYLVTFECDENIVSFGNTTFDWWKVGLDTASVKNNNLRYLVKILRLKNLGYIKTIQIHSIQLQISVMI